MLLKKGKASNDIVRVTGHTKVNISRIRTGKIRGIRFDTMMEICLELDCQPGDLLRIVDDNELDELLADRRKNREGRIASGLKITAPEHVYEINFCEEDE